LLRAHVIVACSRSIDLDTLIKRLKCFLLIAQGSMNSIMLLLFSM
jgi:hypothetical protein